MKQRIGSIVFSVLGIRRATLFHFCRHFEIDIYKEIENYDSSKPIQDQHLTHNFIYFLIENKIFLNFFEEDYYLDKSIEIIANKINRKTAEIENYFKLKELKIDKKYPYRYISSYQIDYALNGNYNFLKYLPNHRYEGNFEYRRNLIEN